MGIRAIFSSYSALSLAIAASFVCHCILLGESAPPRFSGVTWSTTYPGHRPEVFPVEGQGTECTNACFAVGCR